MTGEVTQYHSLFDPIGDVELLGEATIPPDIRTLVDIHKNKESNEDERKILLNKFLKEYTEFYKVESFGHVHSATKDFRVVPEKVADRLHNQP